MSDDGGEKPETRSNAGNGAAPGKGLPPQAVRALDEAAARRKLVKNQAAKESGGPKGAEPTRYGDWERGGRAVDF